MEEKLTQLKQLLGEVADLGYSQAVLSWDQQTYMPSGGAEDRGDLISTLARIQHQKFTSDEIGRLLEDLKPYAGQMDPDSDDARLIMVTSREYRKNTCVPSRWVAEFAKETTLGESVWEEAKHKADFSIFCPNLKRVIDLRREYASFFAPYDHIYDPLLDDFEPGMKTSEVKAIFDVIRPRQVELIRAITERPQIDDSFIMREYPEKGQWDFGVEVITRFGYDWKRGRQDKVVHPFTTSFGIDDVRITTRFDPKRGASALFSTMHECGHALYDQGYPRSFRRTPLANGASMAIHESQSRMWENLVGRSLPFWRFFFPRFKEMFPAQVGDMDLMTFYKGINKVEPSLIRVEADEATYNLHIMLRMELEIALMEEKLKVEDLPEAWNAHMRDYLGLVPPDDSVGVLQDVHWSGGMIGYFPTYALGNLVSAQLWETMQKQMPDLEDQISRGDFSNLLAWLRKNIHQHGRKFEPQDLVKQVTGSKIDPQPYIRYLTKKFSEIYGL
jgi:carboxypeptidase Taq